MKTVYYLLPIFNEAGGLARLLQELHAQILPKNWVYQILAINDGSRDASLAILEEQKKNYRLDVISYTPNRGIPEVLKVGLTALARRVEDTDAVVVMESDGTSDLSLIPRFLEAMESGADIVIGSRSIPGGAYKNFPLERKLGSLATNFFLRCLWRLPGVSDYTIFYRAYRGRSIKQLIEKGLIFQSKKSFAANGELLLQLAPYAPVIRELPLQYDYGLKKGKTKMKLFETLWEYMRIKR